MSTSREVDDLRSETRACVNSHFAVGGGNRAFFERVVLSPSLYMLSNTSILFNLHEL